MATSRRQRGFELTSTPSHHIPVQIDHYGRALLLEDTQYLPVHYAWGEADRQRMNGQLRSRSPSVTSDYFTDTNADDGVGPADGWTETEIDDLPEGGGETIRLGPCPDCRRRNIVCYCDESPFRGDVDVSASSPFLVMNIHSTISKDRTAGEEARHADLLAHLGKTTRNCITNNRLLHTENNMEDNMDSQDSKYTSEREEVVTRILQCRPGAWYDILGLEEVKNTCTYDDVDYAYIRLRKRLGPLKGDMDVSDRDRQAQRQIDHALRVVVKEVGEEERRKEREVPSIRQS